MKETAEKRWSSLQAAAPRATNTVTITAVKENTIKCQKTGDSTNNSDNRRFFLNRLHKQKCRQKN